MDPDALLAAESRLRDAMLANDVAALDDLIDDALVFTALDGAVVGKQDDLDAHRARRLRLERLDWTDRHVVHCGDAAVVSVLAELDGTWDGVPVGGRFRYTRVWCKRPNGWRIVAGHVSAVPA